MNLSAADLAGGDKILPSSDPTPVPAAHIRGGHHSIVKLALSWNGQFVDHVQVLAESKLDVYLTPKRQPMPTSVGFSLWKVQNFC